MSTDTANPTAAKPSEPPFASLPEEDSPEEKIEDTGAALLVREGHELPADGPHLTFSSDSMLAGLPLQLDVTVPIASFRVGDLLALESGTVLESQWAHDEDVPVWCGGSQLAWTEFEVVDQKLAVRITRIG